MADYNDPNSPHDESLAIGGQPAEVEEIQYGKGPGGAAMGGAADFWGHPKGLWVLFITEMWERFSYYGMRALLVLYLVAATSEIVAGEANNNPGFGWDNGDAYLLYGVYTFMVYLTSIFGGMVADRLLGTHRSMLLGGWIIASGHITLALTELFHFERGPAVSPENGPGALYTFLFGLSLIIIGTGFFKPCVSVMVGQLYRENDARRDSGFTIFYMGINLGALLSPLVAGSLGQLVGWHWGFGSAAVGMILGLIGYQFLRPKYLRGIGDPSASGPMSSHDKRLVAIALLLLLGTPLLPLGLQISGGLEPVMAWWSGLTENVPWWGIPAVFGALLVLSISAFLSMQPQETRSRLAVIFILAIIGNLGFWIAFEQAGSSMNVFADVNTDRTLWGLFGENGVTGLFKNGGFPSTWYQSVNSTAILIFAPFFSILWIRLAKKKLEPSTPMKFAIGLWLLGLAFIAMVFGSMQTNDGGLAGPQWLLITYVVYTWGELCLSPVGLSMVTKLAPKNLQSLMMGLWFFSLALSNLGAGIAARYSVNFIVQPGETEAKWTFLVKGQAGFYLLLVVCPIAVGVLIAIMTPMLRKMMKGIH
ncbi:MAG: peptide MFS transporter [Phycisphaeraceae bacterium]|nr:peptide MFS transporter [Phycisphaeraceae bacterium]